MCLLLPGGFSPLCFPQPSRSCLSPVCSKCRFTRVNHEYRQRIFQQYLQREKKQVVGVGGVQMQLVNVLSKPTVFMSQWSWQSVSLWTLTTRVKTEDESSHTSLNRVSSHPTIAGFLMTEGPTQLYLHRRRSKHISRCKHTLKYTSNTNSGFRLMPARQHNWWPEWPEGHLWLHSCVYPLSLSVLAANYSLFTFNAKNYLLLTTPPTQHICSGRQFNRLWNSFIQKAPESLSLTFFDCGKYMDTWMPSHSNMLIGSFTLYFIGILH